MDFVGTLTEAEEAVQRYGNILASHLSSLIEFEAQIISKSFNINCTCLERHEQWFDRHFYLGRSLKSQLHLVFCYPWLIYNHSWFHCCSAYLQPGPRWLSVPPCRTLWRQLDSGRTAHTSCPPLSNGETWASLWCTRGPSSADSPGSPVHPTHVSHIYHNSSSTHPKLWHFVVVCILPVCPAAAHRGWGTGSSWRPARGPAQAAGGGTRRPGSELPRPGPASPHSSRPASSPPLSHARCSCHWREREKEREGKNY